MSRPLDVMGITEISAVTGVKVVTLSAWLTRGHMPEPDARLACGPIWRASTIDDWAAGHGSARIARTATEAADRLHVIVSASPSSADAPL